MKPGANKNYSTPIVVITVLVMLVFTVMAYVTHSDQPFSFLFDTDSIDITKQTFSENTSYRSNKDNNVASISMDLNKPHTRQTTPPDDDEHSHTYENSLNSTSPDETRHENIEDTVKTDTTTYNSIASSNAQPTYTPALYFQPVSPQSNQVTSLSGISPDTVKTNSNPDPASPNNNNTEDTNMTDQLPDGNYTEPPFSTTPEGQTTASIPCPSLITPQMKNRYNFIILSQMGCNPTFSY